LSGSTPKKSLSIYRKILFVSTISLPILFFLFMLSIQLPSKYEYLILVLIVLAIPISLIGMIGTPFILSKIREEDIEALIDKVRDWEPVIKGQLNIRDRILDSVYNKTLEWLESVGADIHQRDSPKYILAFHERYDANFKGIKFSSQVENWEKFFEISINELGDSVRITMEIYSGWQRTALDQYVKRKRIWQQFVDDYCKYIDAEIESIDIISPSIVSESLFTKLFLSPGSYGIVVFILIMLGVFFWGAEQLLTVNRALIIIGFVFLLGLFASYRAITS
jgi:hypothetical protein